MACQKTQGTVTPRGSPPPAGPSRTSHRLARLTRCASTPIFDQSEVAAAIIDFETPRRSPRHVKSDTETESEDSGFQSLDSISLSTNETPTSSTSSSLCFSGGARPKTSKAAVHLRERDLCFKNGSGSLEISADSCINLETRFEAVAASSSSCRSDKILRKVSREGEERVDYIKFFMERGMHHIIVKRILESVTPADLCSILGVSKIWREAVLADAESMTRRSDYLKQHKLNLENDLAYTRVLRSSPRKAMSNVSNLLTLSPTYNSKRVGDEKLRPKQPDSPSKVRHKLFTREASKLSPGEKLQCCPRCTSPSRVSDAGSALCSSRSCEFHFCTLCMCEAHSGTPCRATAAASGRTRRTKGVVASNLSKRRLKRL